MSLQTTKRLEKLVRELNAGVICSMWHLLDNSSIRTCSLMWPLTFTQPAVAVSIRGGPSAQPATSRRALRVQMGGNPMPVRASKT